MGCVCFVFHPTIAIDKRKSLTELENLDFKAIRDDGGKKAIALSDGQKLMLRAGLQKLKILEKEFLNLDARKAPKMLVVCEDTSVSPLVEAFLCGEGLVEENILRVDSNRSGEMTADAWREIKRRLFNIDSSQKCKVVVSVLMLRAFFLPIRLPVSENNKKRSRRRAFAVCGNVF